MPVKEQHLEQDMEQWTDSKSGKEYIEAICCHPAYVIYMQSVVLVTQSCPTLCNPMDCSPPGSSVHGILQARILEWAAISFCIIGRSTSCEMSGWMKHKLESSKIAGRNINNLRYADDTTLVAEGEEELNRLLMQHERGE